MALALFGFELTRKKESKTQEDVSKTFALPSTDDGAVTIQTGAHYGTYVDLDGVVRNEIELITRYREMSMQPELETAIDEIVNEAIVTEDNGQSIEIIVDEIKASEGVKKKIKTEFDYVLRLLSFGNSGHDIFRRWYIDGRLNYHIIINDKSPTQGIKELRYIDPRRIRKIREVVKSKDPNTALDIIKQVKEYYLYNERGIIGAHNNMGTKISPDSIVNVNSGLMDSKRAMVLSYLHKAIKPLNNLRMVEDATVIYRMSRAPERRIFYVDVGNMPTVKAEQYLRDIMVKYRNKLVYDSSTGEIRDDRKHMSMLEDFWLPRREGSRGTEITTLGGGENLGKMEDVQYFNGKLYKALGVPAGRLEGQQGFSLGRTTEITRDELKFNKFVSRLRNKFTALFDDLLRVQLILKKVCTEDEWKEFREDIWYDFLKDNNFDELKESELLTNRLQLLAMAEPFTGKYFSKKWVSKNILRLDDDEMEDIKTQIAAEYAEDPSGPIDLSGGAAGGGAAPPDEAQQDVTNQIAMLQQQVQQLAPQPPSKFEVQNGEMEQVQ